MWFFILADYHITMESMYHNYTRNDNVLTHNVRSAMI